MLVCTCACVVLRAFVIALACNRPFAYPLSGGMETRCFLCCHRLVRTMLLQNTPTTSGQPYSELSYKRLWCDPLPVSRNFDR